MISKERIQQLAEEGKTSYAMAKELGVSVGSVKYWAKKYCLALRINSKRDVWSKRLEQIRKVLPSCSSYTEICRKLNISTHGNVLKGLKRVVTQENLDVTHFKSGGQLTGKASKLSKAQLGSFLVEGTPNSVVNRRQIRRALILFREYTCSVCGIAASWNKAPLTLQVDHCNGKPWDNRLDNLRFICPNCHSQTENFGSKNRVKFVV